MGKNRKKELEVIRIKSVEIVNKGKCPDCGHPLKRNTSLAGWYQCVGYACKDFRDQEFKNIPSCHFQCFTQ